MEKNAENQRKSTKNVDWKNTDIDKNIDADVDQYEINQNQYNINYETTAYVKIEDAQIFFRLQWGLDPWSQGPSSLCMTMDVLKEYIDGDGPDPFIRKVYDEIDSKGKDISYKNIVVVFYI